MSTRKIEIKRRQMVACFFAAFYLLLVSDRLSAGPAESDEAAHFRAKMQIRVLERVANMRDDDTGVRLWLIAELDESSQRSPETSQPDLTPRTTSVTRYPYQFQININGP
jgi:hypothetical protein